MELQFKQREQLKAKPADESKLGFGKVFTDYMLMMKHNKEGWNYAAIEPYGDLTLSPAAVVLHYSQEVFEGLKAYRAEDGRILMFRPWDNIARLASTAEIPIGILTAFVGAPFFLYLITKEGRRK